MKHAFIFYHPQKAFVFIYSCTYLFSLVFLFLFLHLLHSSMQISLTPDVDAGLPPVRVPSFRVDVNGTTVDALSEVGVGYAVVALVGILESIAIGKAFARLG